VGGVVGFLVCAAVAIVALLCYRRQRRSHEAAPYVRSVNNPTYDTNVGLDNSVTSVPNGRSTLTFEGGGGLDSTCHI
jgi:hypothetical protein